MAAPADGHGGRHCIICNVTIVRTKTYKTLLLDESMSHERRLAAKITNRIIIQDLSEVTHDDVGHLISEKYSAVCMQCLRRAKKINKLRKELEAEQGQITSDFNKTHNNENRPPALLQPPPPPPPLPPPPPAATATSPLLPLPTTPDRGARRKRPQVGTPSKGFSPSTKPPSRKRTSLFKEPEPSKTIHHGIKYEISVQREVNNELQKTSKVLETQWHPLADALILGDTPEAYIQVSILPDVKSSVVKELTNSIDRECTVLCSTEGGSSFKLRTVEDLNNLNAIEQEKELSVKAPIFLTMLEAAANSQQVLKNKIKTADTLVHGVVAAAGVLLNCRSTRMNATQMLTALQLHQGGASKVTFQRLQKRFMCVTRRTMIAWQDRMCEGFDREVKEWQEAVFRESIVERELEAILAETPDDEEALQRLQTLNALRNLGYCKIGDNVNYRILPRFMGIGRAATNFDMYNMVAVLNRISPYHLSNTEPVAEYSSFNMKNLLPSVDDNDKLRDHWICLVGCIITKYFPHLEWISQYFDAVISHRYSQEMSKKSNVVQLGVLMENENSTEGMKNITIYQHQYVPGHRTETPVRILSAGDQLTVERQSKALEDVRDTASVDLTLRQDGLMPVTGDFHLLGNFYQAIWKKCFNRSSVGDIGTMAHAKRIMGAKNLPDNPMKDINASKVFLDKYTEALVVTAAMEFFGMTEVNSAPTQNVPSATRESVTEVLGNFVETYALPSEADITSMSILKCPVCAKPWKQIDDLKAHIRQKHPHPGPDSDDHDAVYAYSCAVMSMCLIAYDFTDARQLGDGDRIVLLLKYMMLYFRSAGKSKYAHQVLRQLAQINCFLTKREAFNVVWNRFVNVKGRSDSNVELDRVVEGSNLVFKNNCRGLHGQVTQETVNRASRSSQKIHKVLRREDKLTGRKAGSGKRRVVNATDDVKTLVKTMAPERPFCATNVGRYYKAFPGFTRGHVISVDHRNLHSWMKTTLNTFSRLHMFKSPAEREKTFDQITEISDE